MAAPDAGADKSADNASFPPDFTTDRIPFLLSMSFTISASAGEPSRYSWTKLASLVSVAPVSGDNLSTNCASSSGQRVTPASYSDSQIGQNIFLLALSNCFDVLPVLCSLCF